MSILCTVKGRLSVDSGRLSVGSGRLSVRVVKSVGWVRQMGRRKVRLVGRSGG